MCTRLQLSRRRRREKQDDALKTAATQLQGRSRGFRNAAWAVANLSPYSFSLQLSAKDGQLRAQLCKYYSLDSRPVLGHAPLNTPPSRTTIFY